MSNSTDPNDLPQESGQPRQDARLSQPRMVSSEDILRGDKEVIILHHGEPYRLRATRNGKLVLGK